MITRTFQVGKNTWLDSMKKAKQQGLNVSVVIRLLLAKWLRGEIEI